MRSARALALIAFAAAVIAALGGAGSSPAAGGPTNPKHFFWAPGQRPGRHRRLGHERPHLPRRQLSATARSASRRSPPSISSTGGRVGQRLHDARRQRHALLEQDAAELRQLVLRPTSAAAPGPACRPSTAGTFRPARPAAPECRAPTTSRTRRSQLKGVWTDPTPVPDDIVDARPRREPGRRSDRDGSATRGGALPVRPAGDLHHPDAAAARSRPGSPCTAGTTRRPRASTVSATRSASSTHSSRSRTWTGRGWQAAAAASTSSMRRATRSATASSTATASSSATSTPRRSPTRTTSSRSRTAGTTNQGSENGDKCAWIDTQNITLGGHQFAIQPMWWNEAFDAGKDGCAVSR